MSDNFDSMIIDVLRTHGRLSVPAGELRADADLFAAGLTSHATVNVMLALESAFNVEFPDHMLRRSVFGSVASIRDALSELARAAA